MHNLAGPKWGDSHCRVGTFASAGFARTLTAQCRQTRVPGRSTLHDSATECLSRDTALVVLRRRHAFGQLPRLGRAVAQNLLVAPATFYRSLGCTVSMLLRHWDITAELRCAHETGHLGSRARSHLPFEGSTCKGNEKGSTSPWLRNVDRFRSIVGLNEPPWVSNPT